MDTSFLSSLRRPLALGLLAWATLFAAPDAGTAANLDLGLHIERPTGQGPRLVWKNDPTGVPRIEYTTDFATWHSLDIPHTQAGDTLQSEIPGYLWNGPRRFFRILRHANFTTPVPLAPGFYTHQTFVHGGLLRTYRLKIPAGWNNQTSWPLMLHLHGHGQQAADFLPDNSTLLPIADQRGWIICTPDSTAVPVEDTKWFGYTDPHLAPSPYPTITQPHPYVDDAAFLLALVDSLKTSGLNIDPARVYCAGFSNGATMVHFLASKPNHPFAAFAMMDGGTATTSSYNHPYDANSPTSGLPLPVYVPMPWQPRPVLLMSIVCSPPWPFEGRLAGPGIIQRSPAHNVARWTTTNGYPSTSNDPVYDLPVPPTPLVTTTTPWTATGNDRAVVATLHMRPSPGWDSPTWTPAWVPSFTGVFRANEMIPALLATTYPHSVVQISDGPNGARIAVNSGTMVKYEWRPSAADHTNEVVFVVLSDGGHQWTNEQSKLPFNADTEVLSFFESH